MYLADYISNDTKYLFRMVDHFTKFGLAILMKNIKAETILSAFKQLLITNLKPKILPTDNGGELRNKAIENYLKKIILITLQEVLIIHNIKELSKRLI